MWKLARTTLIGGVLFLTPLVMVVVIVGKAFHIMRSIAAQFQGLAPIEALAGYPLVDIMAVVILVLSCFLAGLAARSRWGQKIYGKLDSALLQIIPGYAWIKGMTDSISDDEAEMALKPVLARFDDQCQIGLEVERTTTGWVAVYLPGAPNPHSGTVGYFSADRVEAIDADFKGLVRSFKLLGRGSTAILPRRT